MVVLFPVMFLSTAFVPEALMPEWMQAVNEWNPITYLIEAMRPLMLSGYDWDAIGAALISMGIVGVILQIGDDVVIPPPGETDLRRGSQRVTEPSRNREAPVI